MEMSLRIKHVTGVMLPGPCEEMSTRRKGMNMKIISCEATKGAMQEEKINFYKVLSLGSERVSIDEIKKAYRSMARQYHLDVCPPSTKEECTKKFIELTKVYNILSDPISRQMYDYELGLFDSSGYISSSSMEERRSGSFPKEVWERLLEFFINVDVH